MSQYSLVKESDTHYTVIKNGVGTYNLRFKTKAWSCDCPARKVCKHLAMLPTEALVKRHPRVAIEAAYKVIEVQLWPYRHSIVGSYRRGSETSKDLDIIVLMPLKEFILLPYQLDMTVLQQGEKKISGTIGEIPVDIDRVDMPNHYAAHLLYRTGPAALNIKMRQLAKEKGFKLNETLSAPSEAVIFSMLGMEYIPPEARNEHV